MPYYKWLSRGAIGLYSGFRWPTPGTWVTVEGPLEACVNGIHACRLADLPYWLDDELWTIELTDEVIADDHGVVARGARLVDRLDTWSPDAASAFADVCLQRTLALATKALAERGLEQPPHDSDLERLHSSLDLLASRQVDEYAACVLAYTADTVEYALAAIPGDAGWASCTGYLAAMLAGYVETHDIEAARVATANRVERARQAQWLGARLALPA